MFRNPFSNMVTPPGFATATKTIFFINHFWGEDAAHKLVCKPHQVMIDRTIHAGYYLKRSGSKKEYFLTIIPRGTTEVITLFALIAEVAVDSRSPLVRQLAPRQVALRVIEVINGK